MSPSGTYSHLLEATSYLRMEVTRPFQVVCGDHWPGSQNVTFCLCEIRGSEPWGLQWHCRPGRYWPWALCLVSFLENRVAQTIIEVSFKKFQTKGIPLAYAPPRFSGDLD